MCRDANFALLAPFTMQMNVYIFNLVSYSPDPLLLAGCSQFPLGSYTEVHVCPLSRSRWWQGVHPTGSSSSCSGSLVSPICHKNCFARSFSLTVVWPLTSNPVFLWKRMYLVTVFVLCFSRLLAQLCLISETPGPFTCLKRYALLISEPANLPPTPEFCNNGTKPC